MLNGCKKEETVLEKGVNYSGPLVVSFNNYGGYVKYNAEFIDKWDTLSYEVKIANTTGTAKTDIAVTLQKDDNPINEYNAANGKNLQPILSTGIKLIDNVVIIKAGTRKASFRFAVNPTKLGSGTRAFGVSILKVSGNAVTVNEDDLQSRLVVEIAALNAYDGVYYLKGEFRFHPLYAGPFDAGETIELQTSGVTSIDQFCTIWDEYCQPFSVTPGNPFDINRFGGIAVTYTVNPATNLVTISAGPGNATALEFNVPGYTSKYDPAKKAMYVSWGYRNAAGSLRQFIDTLTFVRKR